MFIELSKEREQGIAPQAVSINVMSIESFRPRGTGTVIQYHTNRADNSETFLESYQVVKEKVERSLNWASESDFMGK